MGAVSLPNHNFPSLPLEITATLHNCLQTTVREISETSGGKYHCHAEDYAKNAPPIRRGMVFSI